ncbi:hypothetical protein [Streptomyces antimicrobicus]|uniref:Type II secretion system protein GspF domain-containing protein n=1 Tax=Streptomyces antimicrobicus TaxID=2883108 RepID=A0ABS8B4C9_9ACTN|nr:hypothetical protein [Streptomyces antimicrobicus]MCB5179418.1 hypothetical protein [Streptomyces antimicrobicus]
MTGQDARTGRRVRRERRRPGGRQGTAAEPDGAPEVLLRAALREPGRLPELLAGFAVRHTGPRAARSVARLRAERPDADVPSLGADVVARGVRRTITEGAFVGGPFVVFIPVAFCAALLSQARTMLELAAVAGRDPTAPRRAAELLVLQGVHPDADTAERALEAYAQEDRRSPEQPARGRISALTALTLRMAKLLGLMTPRGADTAPPARERLATTGRWALLGATFLVGTVAPLVWLPYMAVSYRRSTREVLARAAGYYLTDTPLPPQRAGRSRLDPGMLAAAVRAVGFLVLPALLVVLLYVVDLRLAGSVWPVVLLTLAAASVVAGAVWHLRRRRRAPD